MRLYELFADKGFHTTVFTTFSIDFDAYENIALARLRGSGCRNNIVLVNGRMLTHALSGASVAPRSAGKLYSVSGTGAVGVFHPKIILQLGRRKGRLIVASANATASGLAGNLELAGLIECDEAESAAQGLIAAGWQYVSGLLRRDQITIAQQIAWMEARTPWLLRATPGSGVVSLDDGTQAALLVSDGQMGILNRFVSHVSGSAVEQVVVLSPYWDKDLSAVRELTERLRPKRCLLLIDKERALFPVGALPSLKKVELKDIAPFAEGRFVHAKMLLARTKSADHVLYGSANCTVAALGRDGFAGHNHEACLYRRLPPGDVLRALTLEEFITNAPSVEPSEIPECIAEPELPFDELTYRHPGYFECVFDELIWRPPSGIDPDSGRIELLKADEVPLRCALHAKPPTSGNERRFQIDGAAERPALARLAFSDGFISAPALVTLVDELRAEVREARSSTVERAAHQLAAETEEGLWLLEVLDELEAAENETAPSVSRAPAKAHTDSQERHYRKLDYEQFVAGRRLRAEASVVGRNSLAGTEMSFVRAFLNRAIALDPPTDAAPEADEEAAFRRAFDLGDDVADGLDAIERGDEVSSVLQQGGERNYATAKQEERRRSAQRRANRSQVINAVRSFNDAIGKRARKGGLSPIDLLRLRAVLTIVAASGWSGTEICVKGEQPSRTSLQLLPIAGSNDCWPRVLGQVVFAFFGGRKPAIRHLQIESIYDQLPDDVVECWATCFWMTQACLLAAQSESSLSTLSKAALSLRERVYTLTALSPGELLDDRLVLVMKHLGERFGQRLGVEADAVVKAHADYAHARTVETVSSH